MIEVPKQYEEAIKEIIAILDAYAYDPLHAQALIRMAAIIDTETGEPITALKILMNEYAEMHKYMGEH